MLLLAFLADLVIGDPRWLPHPVRLIGALISGLEKFLRRYFRTPEGEKIGGFLLMLLTVSSAFFATLLLCKAIFVVMERTSHLLGTIAFVYLTATTLAVKGLTDAAGLVIKAVKGDSLVTARKNLSMIVGRDTADLSEGAVLKAATETLAENLSDGIVAPLFYLVIGGLPLAVAYKAVNTLDSMVGYKNEAYIDFGRASARLDDIANYIPARITGILIVFSVYFAGLFRKEGRPFRAAADAVRIMLRDGRNHASPNSGVPEAAMAGGLGVLLGGPSAYGGIIVEKPYIGDAGDKDYLAASEAAIRIVQVASFISVFISAGILYGREALR